MNKEFVPYEESLELKGLGFDEPCFGRYNVPGEFILSGCYSDSPLICILVEQNDICESHTLAPTFSQAFRWFREKHDIQYWLNDGGFLGKVFIKITGYKHDKLYCLSSEPMEYEEAELACLRKLIELVKL